MNKSLRQLFTIVVALFVILGMSTTIIMAIRANQLTNDARNVRALYHEYGAPRGSILAADGSVIAKSDPSNDSFSYQRSYSAGELYAPVTGFLSISQRGWSGVEASRSSLLSGQSEQLLWQRFKSLFTGQENKGANIETSIDPKIQQAAYNSLGSTDGAAVAIEPKTGRILAMVSTPSYDPNQLASHDMSQANSNYGVLSQDAPIRCSTEPLRSCILRGPRSKRWWPPRLWKPANTSRIRRFRQEQATRSPAPSHN